MCPSDLLFDSNSIPFDVLDFKTETTLAVILIKSKQFEQFCPVCRTQSTKLHSYYYRSLRDLSIFDKTVLLKLKCRKFYCNNDSCDRKIFVESFTDHFSKYSRVTNRLCRKLLKIAMLVGGILGARLTQTLNIPASSSTLIRLIHRQNLEHPVASSEIGIDDWAYKKGHNYGTAIIDLNTRRIIDLLPDREAETVENWLLQRPNISIVTRDRFSRYAKGVSKGAPQATQIADRWHLIKNMGEALTKLLERVRQSLKPRLISEAVSQDKSKDQGGLALEKSVQGSMSKRYSQMEQIKKYYKNNVPLRTISRLVGVSRNTVKKYLTLDEPPPKIPSKSNLTDYSDYVQSRLKQEPNLEIIQLWKEIRGKGYKGCKSVFYEHLKGYNKGKRYPSISPDSIPYWSARKVSLLLYRKNEHLSSYEMALINKLKTQSKDIETASAFVSQFRKLFEDKNGQGLQTWIDELSCTNLKELKSFAKGLLTDITAIKNAVSLLWSNGQVEGQINKLKTIKRQMYGRASFDLLRKRLVLDIA